MRRLLKLLVLFAVVLAAWGGVVILLAGNDLRTARTDLQGAKTQTRAFEFERASESLARADKRLKRAEKRLDTLPVTVLGRAPWLGRNIKAVAAIDQAAIGAVKGARAALAAADALPDPQKLAIKGGRFPPIAWEDVGADSAKAAKHFARAEMIVAALPQDLVGLIARARDEFLIEITDARRASRTLGLGAQILPDLLGENGTRRHLIVIQNAAERRATGGAIESFMLMEASDRRITVVRTDPDEAITGTDIDPDAAHGYNLDPDFEAVGVRIADAYAASTGIVPDTVIALDQVALAELLGATGAVTVERHRIATDNAVRFLSRDVLFDYPVEPAQSIFLGKVSRAISHRVLSGNLQVPALAEGLGRAAAGKHILVWARNADSQDALEQIGITGVVDFARADDTDEIAIGVFGNNPSAAEMDYYTRRSIALDIYLHEDGTADVGVNVSFVNAVKRGELPGVVLAKSGFGNLRQEVTAWVGAPEPIGFKKVKVAPGKQGSLRFTPATVSIASTGATFRLIRQPGLFPDAVTVTVHLPPGRSVVSRQGLDSGLRFVGRPEGDIRFGVRFR